MDKPDLPLPVSSPTATKRNSSWSQTITANIPQILLTISGIAMGACAITLLIEEQATPGTQLHRSAAAIVLLTIWFAAQMTYMGLFCVRISALPSLALSNTAFQYQTRALPPAAHYVLRTLTGVLGFILLPVTLAHLSRTGPVMEDFAVYLPFVMSLSAFINSLVGNQPQRLGAWARPDFAAGCGCGQCLRPPPYWCGANGIVCCAMAQGGFGGQGVGSRVLDDVVQGAADGVAGDNV